VNEDRLDRLRSLTAEAARSDGQLAESAERGAPTPGDLYVLSQTADFPVEWLLLDRAPDDPDRWLAVPADTNPLRGPGDLWLGPGQEGGPLSIRCRFAVRLPDRALVGGGHRTGRVPTEHVARALEAVHDHERGTLEVSPLAEETAADPEYRDWERLALDPARKAVAGLASRRPTPEPARPTARVWISIAAALALLSFGLGAWNLTLRQQVGRLSTPVLIGGSQEIVVGSDVRAPVPLRVRQGPQRLLVFIVLSGEAADHERYRVELTDGSGTALWTSPEVPRGPVPELNLVIPGRFLDGPETPRLLVVFGIERDHARPLAEVPIQIESIESAP